MKTLVALLTVLILQQHLALIALELLITGLMKTVRSIQNLYRNPAEKTSLQVSTSLNQTRRCKYSAVHKFNSRGLHHPRAAR